MPTGIGGEVLWLLPATGITDQSGSGNNGTYNGGMGVASRVPTVTRSRKFNTMELGRMKRAMIYIAGFVGVAKRKGGGIIRSMRTLEMANSTYYVSISVRLFSSFVCIL